MKKRSPQDLFENFLIILFVGLLPFEQNLPIMMGKTLPALLILFCGLYLLIFRKEKFFQVLLSREILFFMIFVFVCFGIENFHFIKETSYLIRIFQMIIGIVVIATLLSLDSRNFWTILWALTGVGLVVIVQLGFVFIDLFQFRSTSFYDASLIRAIVYEKSGVGINLNNLSNILAVCVASAITIYKHPQLSFFWKFFLGVSAFLIGLASLATMSRSGFLALVLILASLLFMKRSLRVNPILILGVVALGLFVTPDAVIKRLTLSTETPNDFGKEEGRQRVYNAALTTFPEYWLTGIGEGNYASGWAFKNGFRSHLDVIGAHNSFLQIWIYYGILGVGLLLVSVMSFLRHMKYLWSQEWSFFFTSCAIALVCFLLFSHVLYSKIMSLYLAILYYGSRQTALNPHERVLESS